MCTKNELNIIVLVTFPSMTDHLRLQARSSQYILWAFWWSSTCSAGSFARLSTVWPHPVSLHLQYTHKPWPDKIVTQAPHIPSKMYSLEFLIAPILFSDVMAGHGHGWYRYGSNWLISQMWVCRRVLGTLFPGVCPLALYSRHLAFCEPKSMVLDLW